jgi:energy-coupling factor transporter ATP-binding protein EcfA2
MPHVLSLAGRHVLHASAVEYEGRAVAFAGDSGAGKSTLAAALGRDSGRILTDDAVVLDQREDRFLVSAPYPSLRLWQDSAATLELGRGQCGHRSGKRRFPNGSRISFTAGSSHLVAACLLSRSSSAGRAIFTRIRAAEALACLVQHAFKFDVSERSFLEREFRFLSRLVASVPCYRLTLPDSLEELPSLATLVLEAIQSGRARQIA